MKLFQKIRSNALLKTGANYSLTATTLSIVGMVVSLLNMRWLGPAELGIWQSLSIVTAYVPFLQLGVQSGLNLELPILLGKKDESKARNYIANAYYISILVTIIILVIGISATVVVWLKGLGLKYVFGVLALTAVNVGSSIAYHFIARYRSSMSFDILTSIIRFQIIAMVLCVPLIYFFGFWGLLAYNAVPSLIYAFIMMKRSPFSDTKPRIEKTSTVYLIKRGTIQMLYVQTATAIKTFQQMFLLRFGGTTYVGLFSPALAIGSIVNLLPNQIAQFLVPQMGYKFGNTGQAKDVWPVVRKIMLLIPLAILPFSILLVLMLPWLVNTFFPKYIESILAMQIMAVGFVFSASSMTTNFLYTIKAYKEATFIIMAEFLSYALLPTFFYKVLSMPILVSVAVGVSIAYLVIYITTFLVMKIALFKPRYNCNNQKSEINED